MTIRLALAVIVFLVAVFDVVALFYFFRQDRRQDQVPRLDEFTKAARSRARRHALEDLIAAAKAAGVNRP